ncbi:MAG: hypothetical protein DMF04_10605 [Verrucomicrobia bacterium]|nr:MAG: hypothetical protein DMF04_10605 [Verrucomicrobiota bacterium]
MLLCVEAPTLPIFCGRLGACNNLILPAEESFRRRSVTAKPGLTFGVAAQCAFCSQPDRIFLTIREMQALHPKREAISFQYEG